MPRFTKSADTSAMASCPTLPVKTGGTGSRDELASPLALVSIVGVKELSPPEFWRVEGLAGTSIPESATGLAIFEVSEVTFLVIELAGISLLENENGRSRRDRAACGKEIDGENEETRKEISLHSK